MKRAANEKRPQNNDGDACLSRSQEMQIEVQLDVKMSTTEACPAELGRARRRRLFARRPARRRILWVLLQPCVHLAAFVPVWIDFRGRELGVCQRVPRQPRACPCLGSPERFDRRALVRVARLWHEDGVTIHDLRDRATQCRRLNHLRFCHSARSFSCLSRANRSPVSPTG